MNETLKLKRGYGLVFSGTNWKLAGDKSWKEHPMYAPSGDEPLIGKRVIRGQEHCVFRCKDDDFLAQPTPTCALPESQDPTEVLSEPPVKA